MAVANYESTHGHLPPAHVLGPDGRPWHSWRMLVLPYIEQQTLHDAYHFDEPWDGPRNRDLAGRMPAMYHFHGAHDPADPTTSYLAVVGPDTAWPGATPRHLCEVLDGTADTILLVENHGAGVHWMEPRDLVLADMDLTVDHPAGVSSRYQGPAVAMLDGAVRRLTADLTPATLRGLLTAHGGEPLTRTAAGWEPLADGRRRPPKP